MGLFNFTSEESMQAAIEAAPTLSGRQLIWATPDDVRLFCPKCSSPEHKAKDCNDMQFRGRKPTPKALISTYKKHGIVTAATKQADQDNRNNAKKTTSRSRNRSVSRNHSDNSSGPSKSVSYADTAKGTNLNSSIYAPTNSGQGKNKNQLNNISPDIINTLLATVQQATTELQSITQRINNWEAAFASQQEELKQQSTRVAAIERILDIPSPIAPITSSSPSSIVVSMPSS